MFDIAKLDRQIDILKTESAKLRFNNNKAAWAEAKAHQFDEIAETLRQVRQQQQMKGVKT